MIRYADDCVVMCRTQAEAEGALARIRELIEHRGLTLHPEKTRLVDATALGGFDFLGYHFEQGRRYPRKKSLRKLKDAIRERTRRANGHSLGRIIENINPILRGWFAYFKHSHVYAFTSVDGWVRRRLRTILRRRQHRRGLARGADHQRWPNAFFQQMGLFTMYEAHRLLIQSSLRPPTGEPDAGDLHVRFGGRGSLNRLSLPLYRSHRAAIAPLRGGSGDPALTRGIN